MASILHPRKGRRSERKGRGQDGKGTDREGRDGKNMKDGWNEGRKEGRKEGYQGRTTIKKGRISRKEEIITKKGTKEGT